MRSIVTILMFSLALSGCVQNQATRDPLQLSENPREYFSPNIGQERRGAVVREYEGPLEECHEVIAFREVMESVREDAIEKNKVLLGIPVDFQARVQLVICDRHESEDANMLTTSVVEVDGSTTAYIKIFANALVSLRCEPEKTLRHEVNHALLREYLGPAYEQVPVWFREGVALYSAGQGESRIQKIVGYLFWKAKDDEDVMKIPELLVDGIDDAHNYNDYAEDVMLVESLISKNENVIRDVVKLLKDSKSFDEAIAAATDVDKFTPGDFLEQPTGVFGVKNNGSYPESEAFALMNVIRHSTNEGNVEKPNNLVFFLGIARDWIANNRYSLVAPVLQFHMARAQLVLNRPHEAVAMLEAFLSGPQGAGPLTGTVLQGLAVGYALNGETDKAVGVCQRLVWGFNYDKRRVDWANNKIKELKASR